MNQTIIAFLGAGIMGIPMAHRLLDAGYALRIHSRTRARARELEAKGAVWSHTAAEAVKGANFVISMVTDGPDVLELYLGTDGVVSAISPGVVCSDMSTIAPQVATQVCDRVRERGAAFLDAPVSGGRTGAEAGTLAIMVGGNVEDLDLMRPVFSAMGKTIVHCGPVGNGQLTKCCNQILCGVNLLAVCEALVFARRVGLDPSVVIAAVRDGAAGSWALSQLGPRMVARDFAPMFMVDLQQKDLRIALDTAARLQVPLPATALTSQLLAANQASGEGKEGTQALIKTLERLANLD